MKKALALLLALVLVLSLAACGNTAASAAASSAAADTAAQSTEAADDAAETEAAPAAASAAEGEESAAIVLDENTPLSVVLENVEPLELPFTDEAPTYQIWMAAPGTISQVDDLAHANEAYAALQERTGINIEFVMGNFFTQMDDFNLMAASGDFYAVMSGVTGLYSSGPDSAVEQEIFLDMTDYLEEYAPNYTAILNADRQLRNEVTTPEGRVVAFYSLYDYAKYGLGDKGYLIRQDWLDDLSLEMPTTYDELHDVLAAFKTEKGADSAFVLPTSGMNNFVMGGFGVAETFYVEDGTIKFGPMEEGFKEYLELMSQWYAEGLMYNDFYCYANEIMFDGTDLIGADQVALYYNEIATMTSYAEYNNDPKFLLNAIAPVAKEEGDTIYMTEFTPTYVDNSRWTITTNCEEPEIFMQVCDYLYTEEGQLLANYGIEGVSFEYNAEGNPEYNDLILNNADGYAPRDARALHTMDGVGTIYDPLRLATGYTELQIAAWDNWTNANLDYSKALPSKELLNAEEKEEYSGMYSDIETFLEEMITKYIIGDASFDSYDSEFVGKLEAMNIEGCIELYQGAYDRFVETH